MNLRESSGDGMQRGEREDEWLSLEQMVCRQKEDASYYRVSIIITCYNQKDLIGIALGSVLEQVTNFPIQVLIGDDASQDGSLELLRRYERDYPDKVQVIARQQNVGLIANRTDLFFRCEAPYVAMLDGDDYWTDPHQLQRKYDFLQSHEEFIAYYTGGGRLKDGVLDRETDYAKRNCYHPFTRMDALRNEYPGIQDGFFFRNIFKYQPEGLIRDFAGVPVEYSSKLPIVLGMLGDAYRGDREMTYIYRDLAGTGSKKKTVLTYYKSRIAMQDMIRNLFGTEMQVQDQMEDLIWNAFISALRRAENADDETKKKAEREAFRTIWNDGYFTKPQICRIICRKIWRKIISWLTGSNDREGYDK